MRTHLKKLFFPLPQVKLLFLILTLAPLYFALWAAPSTDPAAVSQARGKAEVVTSVVVAKGEKFQTVTRRLFVDDGQARVEYLFPLFEERRGIEAVEGRVVTLRWTGSLLPAALALEERRFVLTLKVGDEVLVEEPAARAFYVAGAWRVVGWSLGVLLLYLAAARYSSSIPSDHPTTRHAPAT